MLTIDEQCYRDILGVDLPRPIIIGPAESAYRQAPQVFQLWRPGNAPTDDVPVKRSDLAGCLCQPETLFTFIHVPNHRCEEREANTRLSSSVISRMIREAVDYRGF